MDVRPIALVEDKGLRALLRHLEPGYKIPRRTNLTTLIKKQWKDGQEALGAVLKTPDFISLTTDIWTSRSTQAFEMTTHFLSSDWELKRCVLETRLFSGNHTGVRIAEKIKASLEQYGIAAETVTTVVHDEAANACLAGRILGESDNWESIVCFAHRLQNAIKDTVQKPALQNLLAKC